MKRIFWHIIAWVKSLFGAKHKAQPTLQIDGCKRYMTTAFEECNRAHAKRERRKLERLRNARLL